MNFSAMCEELQGIIVKSYEEGVSLDEAERLAARFLDAQIQVANRLQAADLDARMKKTGVKAIKAAVYLEAATKDAKKPSDVMLQALVDSSDIVAGQQTGYDTAESERDHLQNLLNIFKESHVYYRGVAKGRFE